MQTRSHGAENQQGYSLMISRTAPKLVDPSVQAKVQFLKDWEVYKENTISQCRGRGENPARVLETMKSSIEKQMLEFWCRVLWKVNLDTLTDEDIKRRLEDEVSQLDKDMIPNIKPFFKEKLKMDLKETDVQARVIRYFLLGEKITKDNGWTKCFESEKGKRKYCKILIQNLEPSELKDMVEEIIDFHNPKALDDPDNLYEVILENARKQNARFLSSKKKKNKTRSHGAEENRDKYKKQKTSNRKDSYKTQGEEKHTGNQKTQEGTCFHCQGNHKLKDCPTATYADRSKIWDKKKATYRKNNKTSQ